MALDLAARLAELAPRYSVPGASVAVFDGTDVSEAATGVLNLETGVETTSDSLFQIGSITKPYTATVTMRLVQDGAFALDDPVVRWLPEFRVADPDVTAHVTIRQLLSHTSGFDGDHFHDTGRGDDCLERYVASCAGLTQLHPPGATMSYCNSGYSVLGRLIEKVTGRVFDTALRDYLLEPLGVTHTATLPEHALRFRTAIGHVGEPKQLRLASQWGLMRSAGPAGAVCASARDVLAFARLHLDGGTTASGERLLAERTVAAMREPQVAVPDRWTFGSHWGLGWILFGWDADVYGHDGNTIGQSAFLRIVPEQRVAFVLLTNGGRTDELAHALAQEVLGELCGVPVPEPPAPASPAPAFDPAGYVGRYERASTCVDVTEHDGQLEILTTLTGELAELNDTEDARTALLPVDLDAGLFVTREDEFAKWTPAVFFDLPNGRRYVHHGARATPRTAIRA
jgi:CubicO group peptidase (beta-lactamase class C family)